MGAFANALAPLVLRYFQKRMESYMRLILRRHNKNPHLFVLWQNRRGEIATVPEWLISTGLILSLIIMVVAGIDRAGKVWAALVLGAFVIILYVDYRMRLDPWQRD